MKRARRLTTAGLVVLGVFAGGLGLAVPALAAAPEVESESVPFLTPFEARLEAVVNAGEESTECHFQYGKTSVSENEVPCEQAILEGGEQGVGVTVTGLEPNTAYHYRVLVKNATGEAEGAEEGFTTLGKALVGSEEAGSITRVTATVSAKIDPEGSPATYHVDYGETNAYGEHTPEITAGEGFGEEAVRGGLEGLEPGTTYHYAVVVTNQAGTVTGPDQTFTTAPPTPPTASTGGASNVTLTTATLAGAIDPKGLETSYELDLGTDTTYGTGIYGEAGSSAEGVEIEVALQDLAPGSTYHYRIVAINSDGRISGADATFTTPPYSAPIVVPSTLPLLQTPAIAFPTETEPTQQVAAKKHKKRKASHKRKRKAPRKKKR